MSAVAAIYDLLNNTAAVTDDLEMYNNQAAIFTVEPAPEDSPQPLVVIVQTGGILGTGRDRGHKGGELAIDVKLWGNKGDSEKGIRNLADTLWLTLDRADLAITGFEFVYCLAEPPQRLLDPNGFPGFLIPCRVMVRKEDS